MQLIIKKKVTTGSSITITKTSAIAKSKTPLIKNANVNLKTPLINRKLLILVGKSNRTSRKSLKDNYYLKFFLK